MRFWEEDGEVTTPPEQLPLDWERGWWKAGLEGGMEKLAVEGAVTVAASGSKNPGREADH